MDNHREFPFLTSGKFPESDHFRGFSIFLRDCEYESHFLRRTKALDERKHGSIYESHSGETWIRNIHLSLRRPKTSPKLIQEETRRRKNGIAGRVLRIRNLRGSNSATLLKCTRKTEYLFLDRDLILLYHWTNLVRFSPYFASADIVRRFGSFKIPLLNVNVDTNRLYYRHLLTLMWINVDLRTVSISEPKRVAPRDRCHRRMPQSAPAARLRPLLHQNHVEGDMLMRATGLP